MSASVDAATEPELALLIEAMEASGWSGEVVDAQWRLRWVGEETRVLLGGPSDDALGVGGSFMRTRVADPLGHSVVPDAQLAYLRSLLPTLLHDGVDRDQLRSELGPDFGHLADRGAAGSPAARLDRGVRDRHRTAPGGERPLPGAPRPSPRR